MTNFKNKKHVGAITGKVIDPNATENRQPTNTEPLKAFLARPSTWVALIAVVIPAAALAVQVSQNKRDRAEYEASRVVLMEEIRILERAEDDLKASARKAIAEQEAAEARLNELESTLHQSERSIAKKEEDLADITKDLEAGNAERTKLRDEIEQIGQDAVGLQAEIDGLVAARSRAGEELEQALEDLALIATVDQSSSSSEAKSRIHAAIEELGLPKPRQPMDPYWKQFWDKAEELAGYRSSNFQTIKGQPTSTWASRWSGRARMYLSSVQFPRATEVFVYDFGKSGTSSVEAVLKVHGTSSEGHSAYDDIYRDFTMNLPSEWELGQTEISNQSRGSRSFALMKSANVFGRDGSPVCTLILWDIGYGGNRRDSAFTVSLWF